LTTGNRGRPCLIPWQNIYIGQVIKRRTEEQLSIEHRLVQGKPDTVERLLNASQGGGILNTAYIERLNTTFRQCLGGLVRRTRHLYQRETTLHAGLFLVGTVYHFCVYHDSLRLKFYVGERGYRWMQRSPTLTAGLTDYCWSLVYTSFTDNDRTFVIN
jgi:hypothetical protein